MCPACHFLQGMVALAGAQTLLKQFEVSAKVALEAPFERNVEKTIGFGRIQHARGGGFSDFFYEKVVCFHMFS